MFLSLMGLEKTEEVNAWHILVLAASLQNDLNGKI